MLSLFFSLNSVRAFIAQRAVSYINEKYDVDIRIEKLNLFPLGHIDAENVLIRDHHGDTLLFTKRLNTGLKNLTNILNNKIRFSHMEMDSPYLNLCVYEGEKDDNLNIFIKKLEGEKSEGGKPFYLLIQNARWKNGRFVIRNYNVKRESIYEMNGMDSDLDNFIIDGKNLYTTLNHMSFTDKYRIDVRDLSMNFTYTPDSMRLENILLKTDSTELAGLIGFYYTRENLRRFFDEVELKGHLTGHVGALDMNKLSGNIFKPGTKVLIDTDLEGVINELEMVGYKMKVPGNSIASEGDIILYELTDLDNFGFKADFKRLRLSRPGLKNFIPGITEKYIPSWLENAGMMIGKGDFSYQPEQIINHLTILSAAGNLISDFKLNFNEHSSQYKGYFTTSGLHIGRLFDLKETGKIAGKFVVQGKNFSLKKMLSDIKASADYVEYGGYRYKNLNLDGQMRRGIFKGTASVNDPALKSQIDGLINLSGKFNIWNFNTKISHWDLYRSGWIRSDTLAVISFTADMDMKGENINDLIGTLKINNLKYDRSNKNYRLKYLHLISTNENEEKLIKIESDKAINGYMRGKYKIDRMPDMYKQILGTVFTGLKPEKKFEDDYVRFKFNFDSNLLEILDPSIEYTRNTTIKGSISGKDNYIHTDLKSEELIYEGIEMYNAKLTIDNRNPIYNLYVQADSLATGAYTFSQIRAINLTINDTVYLKLKSSGGKLKQDKFNMSAKYHLDSLGIIRFRFSDSYVLFKNKDWHINPEKNTNSINFFTKKDSVSIEDLVIYHKEESVRLNGFDTPMQRNLSLQTDNLQLKDILPDMEGFEIEGIMNLDGHSGKSNGRVFYNANGHINSFSWNKTPLGDVMMNIKTISSKTLFLDIKSIHENNNLFSANGYVDLGSEELDVNLSVNKFPLNPFNKLLEDVFSHIRGKVTGHTLISGKLKNPKYNGTLNAFGAGLTVNELNTDYQFEDNEQILLKGERFVFENSRFFDTKYHTKGKLNGAISFYNFTNWYIDLEINTPNLLVMDTGFSKDALYYGTAFAEGQATIKGYVNKIKIDAAVKSKENTKIYIPLSDVEVIGDDPFINFYSPEEYQQKKEKQHRRERIYEGLQLNLDIDITQDALIEIVLDQEFGSTLKSKGEGTVLMEINTEGKFNMWGSYQVTEGKYIFRYAGVIEKEFDVEPGSVLIWNGDPFRADLDIRAVYFIPAADITPLLKESEIYSRRLAVKVIINIKGDLMKPRIDFELELPDANPVIRSEVEYALRDADTRMLQVISLLYSGNFIDPDIAKFDNRTALEGNLSERVLGVFNTLLENDVFNVKLDYIPDRQDPHTNVKTDSRVGLTIQTKINKRIYINGKLAMPVGRYTKSSVSGDVVVDIWLNENGTIQMRIYNKRTEIEYVNQEESYTRGVGISFQVDFDTFKEFLSKLKIQIDTD